MDRFQYLAVMAVCAAGTLPLEWALRARVYRQPMRLLRTLWLPVLAFCAWDAIAIARGHWTFSARYTTGWQLPFSIPIEELAFFVVIPICALLSLEACRYVLLRWARAAPMRATEPPGGGAATRGLRGRGTQRDGA